jgi:hypothetical protein
MFGSKGKKDVINLIRDLEQLRGELRVEIDNAKNLVKMQEEDQQLDELQKKYRHLKIYFTLTRHASYSGYSQYGFRKHHTTVFTVHALPKKDNEAGEALYSSHHSIHGLEPFLKGLDSSYCREARDNNQ